MTHRLCQPAALASLPGVTWDVAAAGLALPSHFLANNGFGRQALRDAFPRHFSPGHGQSPPPSICESERCAGSVSNPHSCG